jgi:D-serine deaminase-like pyridoxal phosphate-dependent protein
MIPDINKPTLVVNKSRCLSNIEKMAKKAAENGIRFRPHFKTHQSHEIGRWFRQSGTEAITVSSVSMAIYFAADGWKDITIAFPVNILEINEINSLAENIRLNLLVDNETSARFLKDNLVNEAGVYIEIDTGNHRSGVDALKTRRIDQILEVIKGSKLLSFRGFLSHTGQTYAAAGLDEIQHRHADALMKMRSLKHHYQPWWPEVEISLGDTPACSICENWEGVDEIRPGNFIFYDLMQWSLGVCTAEEIAIQVFCPVVSRAIMRNEAVIYGGAVHLSKEFLINSQGKKSYGMVLVTDSETVKQEINQEIFISALSQEHGIIRAPFEVIRYLNIGEMIRVVPVHSCLVADLAGYYLSEDGARLDKMNKSNY